MNVLETPVWYGEIADGRHSVACDFGLLTRQALACPLGDVGVH